MAAEKQGRPRRPRAHEQCALTRRLSPLAPADSGIRVPAPLDRCSRELGGGALDRLLLLHSVLASSLQVSPHVQGAPACWAAERGPWAWPGRVPLG